MTAVAGLIVAGAVALALVGRDVAIRMLADRADARVKRADETAARVDALEARVGEVEVAAAASAKAAQESAKRAEAAVAARVRR